jgi:gluconolactonase
MTVGSNVLLAAVQPDYEAIADPYEILDDRFRACEGDERVVRLFEGCRWAEGPVYVPAGRYLLFSDVPNDRILRWDEPSGVVAIFRQPSAYANGNTLDRQGRLVTCEQGGRRVTRTEHDGTLTVIADRYDERRLNSPNDVVVRSDGSIWFTDPSYGIDSDYEGNRAESEIGACHVYRVDAVTGQCRIVADDFVRPNGLAFSANEQQLFIVDTRRNHIRVFTVSADGTLTGGAVFAECTNGRFDGIRLDERGWIWAAAGDGVHALATDGTLIGKIRIPEQVANVTFGGPKRDRLLVCASTAVYSIYLSTNGVSVLDGRD